MPKPTKEKGKPLSLYIKDRRWSCSTASIFFPPLCYNVVDFLFVFI